MSRRIVILDRPSAAKQAHAYIDQATQAGGYQVEFKKATRTTPQNSKLWAMLSDIAGQVQHNGMSLSPEDWKVLAMYELNRETRLSASMYGEAVVPLGRSSSRLSKAEMSDLIELLYKFGAERGVKWSEPINEKT